MRAGRFGLAAPALAQPATTGLRVIIINDSAGP